MKATKSVGSKKALPEWFIKLIIGAVGDMSSRLDLSVTNTIAMATGPIQDKPIKKYIYVYMKDEPRRFNSHGFHETVKTIPRKKDSFFLTVARGEDCDTYTDLDPELGKFYYIGLVSSLGKFHGFYQMPEHQDKSDCTNQGCCFLYKA